MLAHSFRTPPNPSIIIIFHLGKSIWIILNFDPWKKQKNTKRSKLVVFSHSRTPLVGGFSPSEKNEFVSWDDYSIWKNKIHAPNHQPDLYVCWQIPVSFLPAHFLPPKPPPRDSWCPHSLPVPPICGAANTHLPWGIGLGCVWWWRVMHRFCWLPYVCNW